jgi:hypothetical protein
MQCIPLPTKLYKYTTTRRLLTIEEIESYSAGHRRIKEAS